MFYMILVLLSLGSGVAWISPFSDREKEQPLLICRPDAHISRTPVPKRPDCAFIRGESSRATPRPIVSTIMKPDLHTVRVPIFYCSKLRFHSNCYENFFGATQITKKEEEISMSRYECEALHRDWLESSELETGSTFIGGYDEAPCSWWSTSETTSERVTLIKGLGIYDREHKTIRHGLDISIMCPASSGECGKKGKIMYWDHSHLPSSCMYYPFQDLVGTLSWNEKKENLLLVSPSSGLMFTFSSLRALDDSGCTFPQESTFISDEGIPIRFHHDPTISLSQMMGVTSEQWIILTNETHREKAHPMTRTGLSLDIPKVNAALLSLIESADIVLQAMELKICKLNEMEWETAWALRKLAPLSSLRIFMREHAVIGYFKGPMMYYARCSPSKHWSLELQGACGEFWRLQNPKDLCVRNNDILAVLCPKRCSSSLEGSFLVSINTTHSVDLTAVPLTPFPHQAFFSPLDIHITRPTIPGSTYLSIQELSEGKGIEDLLLQLSLRIDNFEHQVNGTDQSGPVESSMVGSPSTFTSLGFIAGRISTTGNLIWTMVYLSAGMVWILLTIKLLMMIWRMCHKTPGTAQGGPMTRGMEMSFPAGRIL